MSAQAILFHGLGRSQKTMFHQAETILHESLCRIHNPKVATVKTKKAPITSPSRSTMARPDIVQRQWLLN